MRNIFHSSVWDREYHTGDVIKARALRLPSLGSVILKPSRGWKRSNYMFRKTSNFVSWKWQKTPTITHTITTIPASSTFSCLLLLIFLSFFFFKGKFRQLRQVTFVQLGENLCQPCCGASSRHDEKQEGEKVCIWTCTLQQSSLLSIY